MAIHPIFAFIFSGNLIEVAALIQSDPGAVRARKSDWYNATPLHHASYHNQHNITVTLLQHGADVDSKAGNGWTPLHLAAQEGHFAMVKAIWERSSSSLHDVTNDGRTALYIASDKGHTDIVSWILQQDNINVDAATNRDWTPLHAAALAGHSDVVDLLLTHKANINARHNNGSTPLHLACQTGDLNTVLTLMRHNPTLIFDDSGYSPLHTAAQHNHDTIVETLITQFGWDVNLVSKVLLDCNLDDNCRDCQHVVLLF